MRRKITAGIVGLAALAVMIVAQSGWPPYPWGNLGVQRGGYISFGAQGSAGYGLRDVSGTLQVKNLAGAWANVNSGYTDATIRALFSSTATGLTYTNTTGVFSLTTNYSIPLTTDTAKGVSAYGWGDHAGLYTPVAHKTTEDAINGLVYVNGAGTYSAKAIGTDVQAYDAGLAGIAALADAAGWLKNDGAGAFSYATPSKSDVGLSAVENTALSTWAGTANVTTTGTVTAGTWNALRKDVYSSWTDDTDISAVSGACYGQMYNNVGTSKAVEIELPAAVAGMSFTVRVSAAYTIKLDPNGTDRIDVLTSAAGDYLISDAVVGSFIQLKCEVAGHWVMWGMNGTWTEE